MQRKGKIGAIGTGYVSTKLQQSTKVSGKQRIADVTNFDDLLNPYEFPITKLDIEMAFRYADLNSDGAISSKDFALSLARVGINKTDVIAKEYFSYLSPKLKPLKLKHFEQKLEEYNEDFQPWFCRLIVCFLLFVFVFCLFYFCFGYLRCFLEWQSFTTATIFNG